MPSDVSSTGVEFGLRRKVQELEQKLAEAHQREGATSEVLGIIGTSPNDLQPVFQAIAERARQLCKAEVGATSRLEGDVVHLAGVRGPSAEAEQAMRAFFPVELQLAPANIRHALAQRAPFQIADVRLEPGYPDTKAAERMGVRSIVSVPLLHEGRAIGTIGVARGEPGRFSDETVALLQTFARQAVIAIENARLFEAEQVSKRELQESLEYQTATSEVLGVLSRSPTELQPVLDTIARTSQRLCEADRSSVWRLVVGAFELAAFSDYSPAVADYMTRAPVPADRTSVAGRCVLEKRTLHIHDRLSEPGLPPLPQSYASGARTLLCVPLLREGQPIGVLRLSRDKVAPFTTRQIALVETFADQAVIAIENTRLFEAEQASKRELQELLDQQTATSEVLGVISSSPGELEPVFKAILSSAVRICGAKFGTLSLCEGEAFRVAAMHDLPPAFANFVRRGLHRPGPEVPAARAIRTKQVVQIADAKREPYYVEQRDPLAVAGVELGGYRTILAVPMLKEGEPIGVIVFFRQEVRPFTEKQIELIKGFASQAVIAIENARLLNELRESLRQLEITSQHKSQFVANMSHELRTPLAAILGYAELMQEGFYEPLGQKSLDALTRIRSNGKHLLGLINTVLDIAKIESGQFTLNMAEYAIESVVETVRSATESLAQNKKLALKTEVAKSLPVGLGDEQRLTQVLLNLVGNAIKFTDTGEVRVTAKAVNGHFNVSVADTGPGIPEEHQARIFEQFHQVDSSNTKAKGGTGLGLAIAKQIVEMHGGRIWVESTLGKGSTFQMELPTRAQFRKIGP